MHNFVQNRSKSNQLFLFLFFYSVTLSGMEVVVLKKEPLINSNRRSRQPDCIVPIFDPKKAFKSGTSWSNVVPGVIKITPDGKGVVLGQHGTVKHLLFDRECAPRVIIEHACAKKYTPMITMSQKKDRSLLIVSAANYTNSENKRVSEYIVFYDDSSFRKQKLDWFIQAISGDSWGKMLAIAGQHSVTVVDLETNKKSEAFFKCLANNENWITDIAMNPEGKAVIAAGNHGGVQWMSLSKDNNGIVLSNLKQVIVKDDIKNIYYPNRDQLFYITHDGQIKAITMENLLTINGEDVTTTKLSAKLSAGNGEDVTIIDFGSISAGDVFVADSSVVAKVFAPKARGLQKETTSIIEVLRKGNEQDEKLFLEVPSLRDRYDYITEFGQCMSATGDLLHTTISGNVVVGLATDGSMRVWNLPVVICNEVNRKHRNSVEKLDMDSVASTKDVKSKRPRSGSPRSNKHSLVSSDDGEGEKKKPSPRKNTLVSSDEGETVEKTKKPSPRDLIHMLKGSGSKDLSPTRAHKSSDEK